MKTRRAAPGAQGGHSCPASLAQQVTATVTYEEASQEEALVPFYLRLTSKNSRRTVTRRDGVHSVLLHFNCLLLRSSWIPCRCRGRGAWLCSPHSLPHSMTRRSRKRRPLSAERRLPLRRELVALGPETRKKGRKWQRNWTKEVHRRQQQVGSWMSPLMPRRSEQQRQQHCWMDDEDEEQSRSTPPSSADEGT